jgi:hypothetical protein
VRTRPMNVRVVMSQRHQARVQPVHDSPHQPLGGLSQRNPFKDMRAQHCHPVIEICRRQDSPPGDYNARSKRSQLVPPQARQTHRDRSQNPRRKECNFSCVTSAASKEQSLVIPRHHQPVFIVERA